MTSTVRTMRSTMFPRWLMYSLLTVFLWGIWGILFSQAENVSAGQCQAYSTLGILPVIAAVACADGFRSVSFQSRGAGLAFLAGLLVGAGNAAYYQAVSLATTATTISFTMLYPVVTVMLGLLFLRERPSRVQLLGVAGSVAAIALLSVRTSANEQPGAWLGLAVACLLLWGVSALFMKLATDHATAAQATFWFLAAFVPLAAWILIAQPSAVFDKPLDWNPPQRDWLIMIAIGVTFGIGNLTLLAAYRYDGKASIVTPLAGLYPAVSIPLAVLCLGESIEPLQWAGIAVAFLSALALVYEKAPDHDCTRNAENCE